jgi:predicted CoA-binding protein
MDQRPTDATIRDVLDTTRVIACIGASPNPDRPSHYVSQFLISKGYRVIPVNPGQAGKTLFGETVYGRVSDIPAQIEVDMIDLFRRSEHVLPIVEEAIAALPKLRTVWMQLGIENAEAARLAQSHGLTVIQNRCPKIEIPRLLS